MKGNGDTKFGARINPSKDNGTPGPTCARGNHVRCYSLKCGCQCHKRAMK
jgi:hypothetical protein